ncbi:1-phosphofructokinase family hexose kinase [Rugosimonospora africana]|uniref:Sugar kinase n=1 Tax=Rugosimonospora africana TaxID=556532 RepID=A0A8J3QVF9_9ACTN|nr:hexose kinase [Rugosimonospora africana]GIH17568.1 sugar kinase [Rugosimonospora africana]
MILTVTLNTALDVTYEVPALRPGEAHRITGVHERAGGKGVNVARVLHELREPVIATGLVGGGTGTSIRTLLGDLRHSFEDIAGPSRRTTVVVDGSSATGFWEPGPEVTGDEWERFVARYSALLRVARVAVLSGSLPPGLPVDAYARLVEVARSAGVPVILDTSGEALAAGVAAGPDIVKPNAHELAVTSGMPVGVFEPGAVELAETEALAAADAVRNGSRTAVVASLGPYGLVASTPDGRWYARPASALDGNPTGAGDATVAALARGLAYRLTWPDRLADAVGLSGAAVLAPIAGAVSLTDYQKLRRGVHVQEV